MYAKHCLVLCVLLAVVNAVVSQQEEQVRHRFSVYLRFKARPCRPTPVDYRLYSLITKTTPEARRLFLLLCLEAVAPPARNW